MRLDEADETQDDTDTRVLTVTLPALTWFRLDRFMKCEDGWTVEEILFHWIEHMEDVEREHDQKTKENGNATT